MRWDERVFFFSKEFSTFDYICKSLIYCPYIDKQNCIIESSTIEGDLVFLHIEWFLYMYKYIYIYITKGFALS